LSLRTRSTTRRKETRAHSSNALNHSSNALNHSSNSGPNRSSNSVPNNSSPSSSGLNNSSDNGPSSPSDSALNSSSNNNGPSSPNSSSDNGPSSPSNSAPNSSSSNGPYSLSNSAPNSSRGNVLSRPGNNRNVHNSRHARGNSSGDGHSRAAGRGIVRGSRGVLNSGTGSIALGRSGEAMVATTFLRTASVSISGVNTGFGSAASL
jgi:hypothetical protein